MLSTIICFLSVKAIIMTLVLFPVFFFLSLNIYYQVTEKKNRQPNKAEERLREKLRAEKKKGGRS